MTETAIAGAAAHLRSAWSHSPQVAVVLGSGLGRFADILENAQPIPYEQIPGFPRTTVIGHAGRLVLGRLGETWVLAMQGRLHLYEGLPAEAVTFGIQVFAALGVRVVLLTTASGGIHRHFRGGDLMIIEDQLNFQFALPPGDLLIQNETARTVSSCAGPIYSPRLVEVARRVAIAMGLTNVHRGVFAGMLGPTYETPAEVRMAARLGADAISMSVILEALVARSLGLEVVGISAIVNVAAGLLDVPLNHEEVLEGARAMEPVVVAYLTGLVPELVATSA
jgi:purine-nucleoside phosphorylase